MPRSTPLFLQGSRASTHTHNCRSYSIFRKSVAQWRADSCAASRSPSLSPDKLQLPEQLKGRESKALELPADLLQAFEEASATAQASQQVRYLVKSVSVKPTH